MTGRAASQDLLSHDQRPSLTPSSIPPPPSRSSLSARRSSSPSACSAV